MPNSTTSNGLNICPLMLLIFSAYETTVFTYYYSLITPRNTRHDVADWLEITWLGVSESAQKTVAPIVRQRCTWWKKRW